MYVFAVDNSQRLSVLYNMLVTSCEIVGGLRGIKVMIILSLATLSNEMRERIYARLYEQRYISFKFTAVREHFYGAKCR